MQQQPSNPAYQPVPQQDQSYPAGYFAPSKDGAMVSSQPANISPGQQDPRYSSTTNNSYLSPNHIGGMGRDSAAYNPTSPTVTEVDGSDRPLPEADSIQRPQSTHQGMVSPMMTASSPPPPSGQFGQGQGYVNPHVGTHEMPHSQAYAGPYEMANERH
ncbi:MAG: hypothetical protein Q9170_008387 [Blastenia crenularia]